LKPKQKDDFIIKNYLYVLVRGTKYRKQGAISANQLCHHRKLPLHAQILPKEQALFLLNVKKYDQIFKIRIIKDSNNTLISELKYSLSLEGTQLTIIRQL
jgi:hypothetical protein